MTTTATTFAEYAEANGWPPESEYRDAARVLWEQEQKAQASYPQTIPPCPSWCELPAGHPYDSYMPDGSGGVVHTRCHEREVGAVTVLTFENHDGGQVEVDEVGIDYLERRGLEGVSAEQARTVGSDLIAAADLLDRIAAQTRTCLRSLPHEAHDWPSMVAGEDWHCPGVGGESAQ